MNEPSEYGTTPNIPIEVLEQARELTDNAKESGTAMDFDSALDYVQTLTNASKLSILPFREGDPALSTLSSTEVYQLAEAADAALCFDPNEQRRWSTAGLVVDLQNSLTYLNGKDADERATILSATLGVTGGLGADAAPQLVERYFSDSEEQGRFALAALSERAQTDANRP